MIDDPLLLNDWHVVARSSVLKPGDIRPVRLLGNDLVLWRSDAGVHAWQDLCLRRGAKLSDGRTQNDCLVCPYHGWQYNSVGQCVHIPAHPTQPPPARAHTKTFPVKEKYDLIWICLGTPQMNIPHFAEWDDPSFRKVFSGPYLFNAHGPRVIENFLDVGHFPFVHAGYLGDPSHTEIGDYDVETTADGIIARDIAVWQPDPDGTGHSARVKYTYQVLRPLTAYFAKIHGQQRFSMIDIVTPVDERESLAWAIMALNYAPEVSDESLQRFQDVVSGQDIPIVES